MDRVDALAALVPDGSTLPEMALRFILANPQVSTVIPYYVRFLQRYPDIDTLAAAPLDDVLAQWSGLGYYSRGRNLHKAARLIVEDHGGKIIAEAKENEEATFRVYLPRG